MTNRPGETFSGGFFAPPRTAPPPSPGPGIPPPPPFPPSGFGAYPPPSAPTVVLDRFGLPQSPGALVPPAGMPAGPGGYPPASSRTFRPTGRRMTFGERLQAGIDLVRTTGQVLRSEPRLLAVPAVATVVSAVLVIGWVLLLGGWPSATNRLQYALVMAPPALVLAVMGTVVQAVLVDASTTRLQGQQADLGASWRRALSVLPTLIGIGLMAAAERAVSDALRREGLPGRILAAFLNRAWAVLTLLSVPVALYERCGPVESMKRSGRLVADRWGPQLVAQGLIGLGMWVVGLPVLVVLFVVGWLISPLAALILVLLGAAALSAVATTLHGILSAAIYRFAVTGLVSPGFSEADMWLVFRSAPARR